MRQRIFIIAVIVAVLAGLFVTWQFSRTHTSAVVGAIDLINLPDHYCPDKAQVVVTNPSTDKTSVTSDSSVPIAECRRITLATVAGLDGQPRLVTIKLPSALAFRLSVASTAINYSFAPSLGDVNSDNVIDALDEQSVSAASLTTDSALIKNNDIDQDQKVTVLDLALTRVNRRVGVDRPDGQAWRDQ